ncbi:MAG: cation:proton antiporter [Lachnospiraceae bacterium]|nr:cation:proton antiporter [Lachnospiraceae bacterium]MBP5254846.1 cation:proton antiporter [Lachnospiraceae bacterium]
MELLSLSIAILSGLLMTRVFKRFHLPAVTAYLIAGVLIGPYVIGRIGIAGLGFTTPESVEALSLISQVALAFIAFSIGSEFRLSALKQTGMQAVVIGIFQAVTATVLVILALFVFHLIAPDRLTLSQCLTLGAIATATAPAATLMVVREYKAKGPLTSLLLPIVALDDAVGLIIFAVLFGISRTISLGDANLLAIILNPLIEIVLSLVLGAAMGWVLTQLEKLFNSNTNRLNMTIAVVFLTAALSMIEIEAGPLTIGFSSLLTCMMLGTVFCNACPLSEDIMKASDKWTSPLLALFFVVSGAELDLTVFGDLYIVLIGVVYVLVRCVGKYFGARGSAKATHCPEKVQKYLGYTLFPQAGVALGMCTIAMGLGAEGALIRNITLFAILIYELFGPLITKWALTKAGDITAIPQEVVHRRENKLKEAEKREKS